jgi:2-oxoglutarate dehydrogenase E1 component
LTTGRFLEVLPNKPLDKSEVTRVLICSGKIYYSLADHRELAKRSDVSILRLEQLYPFPRAALKAELEKYPNAQVVWCQEEPSNMGAWTFVQERLRSMGVEAIYTGRPSAASPATGSYRRHQAEEQHLLETAFA